MTEILATAGGVAPVHQLHTNGRWRQPEGASAIAIHSPAHGGHLATVSDAGAAEADAAVQAAQHSFESWAALDAFDCARHLCTLALRIANRLRSGVMWINDHHTNDPRSIWDGFAASGYGKQNGWDALKSYLHKPSMVLCTAPGLDDWYGGGHRYG